MLASKIAINEKLRDHKNEAGKDLAFSKMKNLCSRKLVSIPLLCAKAWLTTTAHGVESKKKNIR